MIRFGPRYFLLAADDLAGRPHAWRDVALDQESRQAAALVRTLAHAGRHHLYLGLSPEHGGLHAAAGGLADVGIATSDRRSRRPASSRCDAAWTPIGRGRTGRSCSAVHPSIIVDGLSAYNPRLDIGNYADLGDWFKRYCLAGRAGLTSVYRLRAG